MTPDPDALDRYVDALSGTAVRLARHLGAGPGPKLNVPAMAAESLSRQTVIAEISLLHRHLQDILADMGAPLPIGDDALARAIEARLTCHREQSQ